MHSFYGITFQYFSSRIAGVMIKALELFSEQLVTQEKLKNCKELEYKWRMYWLKGKKSFPLRSKENWSDKKVEKAAICSYVKRYLQMQPSTRLP